MIHGGSWWVSAGHRGLPATGTIRWNCNGNRELTPIPRHTPEPVSPDSNPSATATTVPGIPTKSRVPGADARSARYVRGTPGRALVGQDGRARAGSPVAGHHHPRTGGYRTGVRGRCPGARGPTGFDTFDTFDTPSQGEGVESASARAAGPGTRRPQDAPRATWASPAPHHPTKRSARAQKSTHKQPQQHDTSYTSTHASSRTRDDRAHTTSDRHADRAHDTV